MGTSLPKQYLPLAGKPIALHSFFLLAEMPGVKEIIVVCEEQYRSLFPPLEHPRTLFALPGQRRQDSVWNGLSRVSATAELICIHDSARPLLRSEDCQAVLEAGHRHGAAVLATPVKYTIKSAAQGDFVGETLPRANLWEIQTPQVIIPEWLRLGFAKARDQNDLTVTDDASLVELIGRPIKIVPGSDGNIKITTPADYAFAERYFSTAAASV